MAKPKSPKADTRKQSWLLLIWAAFVLTAGGFLSISKNIPYVDYDVGGIRIFMTFFLISLAQFAASGYLRLEEATTLWDIWCRLLPNGAGRA